MSKKFEYKKIDFLAFETERVLNQYGDDGWEVVSVYDVSSGTTRGQQSVAILKKEVDRHV